MANQKNDLWTVLRMLEWGTGFFKKKQIPDPRHSIEWLLADVLEWKRLALYLAYERPLSPAELEKLRPMIKRRAAHEPLQYIIGHTDFMGCRIDVNPSVLIPRIETEQLVETLLEKTQQRHDEQLNLLDVGTGSGCIPLAIKQAIPGWNCFGSDISADALELAKMNAELNNLDVTFFEADLFRLEDADMPDPPWDIIVSNPPYIEPGERPAIQKQVSTYEPDIALFHESPLDVYKAIAAFAHRRGAMLFLELNDRMADDIREIVLAFYPHAEIANDLDDNPRFLIADTEAN